MKNVTEFTLKLHELEDRLAIYKMAKEEYIRAIDNDNHVSMFVLLIEAYKTQKGETLSPYPISFMANFIAEFPEMSEIRPKGELLGFNWWPAKDFLSHLTAFDAIIEKVKIKIIVLKYNNQTPFDDCN
jgi:hypothetical protein